LRAGFSISGKLFGAVTRNRMKRLMRTAFDAEKKIFSRLSEPLAIELLFVYRGNRSIPVERIMLKHVQQDVASLCSRCVVRLRGERE
jgi:ribonuclease P protein component